MVALQAASLNDVVTSEPFTIPETVLSIIQGDVHLDQISIANLMRSM